MDYKLKDLVDFKKIKEMFTMLYEITGCPLTIVDNDGNPILMTYQEDICIKFHQANPVSRAHCRESDIYLSKQSNKTNEAVMYRCPRGLIDAAAPIIVDGNHIANLFVGQFLTEAPDVGFYKEQAKKFGYDEKEYLDALSKVSILSKEKANESLKFLKFNVEFIADLGLAKLKEKNALKQIERAEEELTKREQYKLITENSSDVISLLDPAGVFLYISPACKKLAGYEPSDIIGHARTEFIHPDDIKLMSISIKELRNKTKESISLSYRIRKKDGTYIWVESNGWPIYDDKTGILKEIQSSTRDITERMKMDEALRESENHYRMLFNSMMNGYALHKMIFNKKGVPIDYTFIDVNPAFEEMTGLYKNNCIGKTVKELMPDVENYWIETYGEVVRTGKAIKYENYAAPLGKHFEVYCFSPMEGYFATLVADVTEHKKASDALIANEAKQKSMIENISDVIIILDKNGIIEYVSPNIEKLFGWMQNEAIGTNAFTTIHPNDVNRVKKEFNKFLKKYNSVITLEFLSKCKDGTYRIIELTASNLLDDPNIKGVLMNYHDITDRKANEEKIIYNSYHDLLTGLYNRRYLEEKIEKMDNYKNNLFSVIVGDVNGMKLINDAFGRKTGDLILQKIAEILLKNCRAKDIVTCWGGDEFLIFLPDTNHDEAEKIVKKLHDECLNTFIESINLSISFGFDTKESLDEDINIIMKNAEDNMYKYKLIETSSMRGKMINTILNTLYEKNPREEQHSRRVSDICYNIAKALNLPETEVNKLKVFGLVHDIGKIALDEEVLNKPSKLTEREWKEIKRHPEIGYRILSSTDEMAELSEYILLHHERMDGTGYPNGLKGDSIPLYDRILAVADTFDAMTSSRPYRDGLPQEVAVEEIKRCSGTQFDPDIAKVFIEKVLGEKWN